MASSVFKRFTSSQHTTSIPERDDFEKVANHPAVKAATDKLLATLPVDSHFESFDDLRKRRNEIGIVPLEPTEVNRKLAL